MGQNAEVKSLTFYAEKVSLTEFQEFPQKYSFDLGQGEATPQRA